MATTPNILIVDDMAILNELVAAVLGARGYKARCATAAREGLALARAQRPDLVLLDPTIGDGGGMRFLRALRADPTLAGVPVIVLMAAADRAHVTEAARLGVQGVLLKGRSSVKELLERVARVAAAAGAAQPAGTKAAGAAAATATATPATATAAAPQAAPRVPANATAAATNAGGPTRLLTREQCLKRAEEALQAKTLSGVVAQVIAQAASPRGDLAQLAEMVARDVVLSAKVLQAANSAAYASNRGMITSIPEAVKHIGCATIRNIAAAVGVFEAMPHTGTDGFNPIRCWQHSFAVAKLCEQLAARQYPDQAGTAYLAGLCHDLGDILFRTHFAAEYARVLDVHRAGGGPMRQLERDMLGITQAELSMTILRCLDLPQAIRGPIEDMHADGAEPRQPLGRVLRLADRYANGLLLAAGGAAPLVPLGRAECRKAAGEDAPACPDGDSVRAEILALTSMLARLSDAEARRLMEPLHPRREVKIWLAREAGLSGFDPIAAALAALGSVQVSDRLPTGREELAGCDGLVVAARSVSAVGLDAGLIGKASEQATAVAAGRPLPVLWLAGADVPAQQQQQAPGPVIPRAWPISIDELAAFVGGSIRRKVRPSVAEAA